jgi:hypothetical protein
MNLIDLRMDNGLAEKKEDGTTIHVDMGDVKRYYGDCVHYLLYKHGHVQIIDDNRPGVRIKRSIIVK